MRPKSKKYNPNKIKTLEFKKKKPNILDHSAIYQIADNDTGFLSLNNTVMDTDALRRLYLGAAYQWSVMIIVFSVKPSGSKGVAVNHLRPPFKVTPEEMAASVIEEHNKMIMKCPPDEFLCPAWLAVPRDELISSVEIEQIFNALGVWRDYKTDNGFTLFEERN